MSDRGPKTSLLSQRELLSVFDKDEEQAEAKYVALCQRLRRFFEWRHVPDAADMVQETIVRGLHNLQGGKEITTEDPARYFMGIAKNVAKECRKRQLPDPFDEQELLKEQPDYLSLNQAELRIYLKECLGQLEEEDFSLLLAHVEGTANEWGLARGLQSGAIRLRVHRLRKRIEDRVSVSTGRAAKKK